MSDTKEFPAVQDPSARDEIHLLREEVTRLAGFCERAIASSERANNIAEASSERTVQAMAVFSQIQAALNVAIQLGEQNKTSQAEMREATASLRADMNDVRGVVSKMREDLYVALGQSKTAEEIAADAKAKAVAVSQKTARVEREVSRLHSDVEQLDDRLDNTDGKRLLELEARRAKSEQDLEARAKEGIELAKKLALEEVQQAHKREEWERQQEERKLALQADEAQRKWAAWGKVLAPTVLLALIGLFVTIAGRC